MTSYPKRLIEVDLPIKRISAHARREKSIRHGHISTLHIWWARRPLAACRAVICAALWPDPADEHCPAAFRTAAARIILDFARKVTTDTKLANDHCSPENYKLWRALVAQVSQPAVSPISQSAGRSNSPTPSENSHAAQAGSTAIQQTGMSALQLRGALLDFIADFANWDNSTVKEYLETSRLLTAVAHNALTDPDFKLPPEGPAFLSTLTAQLSTAAKPLVVDPFAGGGSIPLEALRVGADAFASDLNPVPVLLNKVVLEYIPRFANTEIRIPKSEWKRHWHVTAGTGRGERATASAHAEGVKEITPGLRESASATLGQPKKREQHPEGVPEGVGQIDERTGDLVLHGLADPVRYWGTWIKQEAERELAEFYPRDPDGATPIAYLWARTIQCEGPGCGAEVPLIRSLWLAKKANRSVALQLVPRPRAKRVDFQIIVKQRGGWVDQNDPKTRIEDPKFDGTVKRGSATCPCCGYTTPVEQIRAQLRARRGGTADAVAYCKVVKTRDGGTEYRQVVERDSATIKMAEKRLAQLAETGLRVPTLPLPPDGALGFRVQKYGVAEWGDLFLSRQKLHLLSYLEVVARLKHEDPDILRLLKLLFGLTVSKLSSFSSSLCVWRNVRTCVAQTFGRQTLSMVWDFGEMNPFAESAGDFGEAVEYLAQFIEHVGSSAQQSGSTEEADASASPLADDSADLFFTDPPYYDAIPYHHLSEFFALWLGASGILSLDEKHALKRRAEECIVDEGLGKSREFFEKKMTKALTEGRRVAKPCALGVVVFAHKSTAGWEAQLGAMLDAGWTVTSSWPIDTERTGRLRAQGSAALGSSVHITCRPRENPDGSVRTDEVGDWRDVLAELPRRIHDWMPRLAEEGVVGADAIFACLGPALEVFSRYSRVEKASGEAVTLKEYLEQVWAAVAKEALTMIFSGADAAGFEEDARLTAMWLWTLKTDEPAKHAKDAKEEEDGDADADDGVSRSLASLAGFTLEFDAARKIAQGLGAHLED